MICDDAMIHCLSQFFEIPINAFVIKKRGSAAEAEALTIKTNSFETRKTNISANNFKSELIGVYLKSGLSKSEQLNRNDKNNRVTIPSLPRPPAGESRDGGTIVFVGSIKLFGFRQTRF